MIDITNIVNKHHVDVVKASLLIVSFAIGAIIVPIHPRLNMWGQIVLLAATYGILNDLRACYVCPEYFTVGHIYGGSRLVNSMDTIPNALIWGIVATVQLAAYAGILFCLIVDPIYFNNHFMTVLKFMGFVLIIGEICSLSAQFVINKYKMAPLFGVPNYLQAIWMATGIRNAIGYNVIIVGAVMMLLHYLMKY